MRRSLSLLGARSLAILADPDSFLPYFPAPEPAVGFCGDGFYLRPSEKEQINPKQPHMCIKYNQRVFHGGRHPQIFKCSQCDRRCK